MRKLDDEESPLLPVIEEAANELSGSATSNDYNPEPCRSQRNHTRALNIIFACFFVLLLIGLNIHQIIIPHRLQKALNHPEGVTTDSITLASFTPEGVPVQVLGTRLVKPQPPTNVTLRQTDFEFISLSGQSERPLRKQHPIINSFLSFFGLDVSDWTAEDRFYHDIQKIGKITLPEFITPPGVSSLPLAFSTVFSEINSKAIKVLLDALTARNNRTDLPLLRMQGIPTIKISNIGTYAIPTWTHFPIIPDTDVSLPSLFNVSITDKNFEMIVDPKTFKQYYQIQFVMQWINGLPLIVNAQKFSLTLSVYYKSVPILYITIPRNTIHLIKGLNTHRVVTMKSNPDHMSELLDFIERYSEGEQISVLLKQWKAQYTAEALPIVWLDELLQDLQLTIKPQPPVSDTFLNSFFHL